MKTYKPSAVANFFLQKGREERKPITMLKLIKLSYIAHGWCLALANAELIEEDVEAWQYGPVIPSIYHEFKRFQKNPITSPATEFDFQKLGIVKPELPKNDTETRAILEKVWDVYKTISGSSLISLTHAEGTPWKESYRPDERNTVIPNEIIKKYYENLIENLVSDV